MNKHLFVCFLAWCTFETSALAAKYDELEAKVFATRGQLMSPIETFTSLKSLYINDTPRANEIETLISASELKSSKCSSVYPGKLIADTFYTDLIKANSQYINIVAYLNYFNKEQEALCLAVAKKNAEENTIKIDYLSKDSDAHFWKDWPMV